MRLFFNNILAASRGSRVQAALVATALFFISLRISLESITSGLFASISSQGIEMLSPLPQWFFWHAATLLAVLTCLRYVAKARREYLLLLLPATIILTLPAIIALVLHTTTHFEYLSFKDAWIWPAITTFMFASPQNYLMFPGMMLNGTSIFVVAYLSSRRMGRSLLTVLCAYVALIFVQAFMYVCLDPAECVISFPSRIGPALFAAFYFAPILAAWLGAFLWPELRAYLKRADSVFTGRSLIYAGIGFLPFFVASIWATSAFFDLVFVSFAYFALFYSFALLRAHFKESSLLPLNIFLGAYAVGLGVALTLFFLLAH